MLQSAETTTVRFKKPTYERVEYTGQKTETAVNNFIRILIEGHVKTIFNTAEKMKKYTVLAHSSFSFDLSLVKSLSSLRFVQSSSLDVDGYHELSEERPVKVF